MHVHAAAEPEVRADLKRHNYIHAVRAFVQKNKTKHKITVGDRVVVAHPVGDDSDQLVLELPRPKGMRRSRSVKINIRYLYPGGFAADFYGFTYGAQNKWVDMDSADFRHGFSAPGLLLGMFEAVLDVADGLDPTPVRGAAEPELLNRAAAERAFTQLHKALVTPKTITLAGIAVTVSQAKHRAGFSDPSDIKLSFRHATKLFEATSEIARMFDPPDLYVHIRGRKHVAYENYPLTAPELLRFIVTKFLEQVYGDGFVARGGNTKAVKAAAEPEEYAGAEKRWIKAVRALPKDGIHARLLGKETSVTPERNHLGEMGVGFDFYYNDVKYRVAVLSSGARLRIHSHHPVLYVRKPELEIPAGHGADLLRAVMLVVARKLSLPGAVTAAAEPVVSIHDRLLKLHAALENKPKAVFEIGEDR